MNPETPNLENKEKPPKLIACFFLEKDAPIYFEQLIQEKGIKK